MDDCEIGDKQLYSFIRKTSIGSITGHCHRTLILHYAHSTRQSRRIAGKVLGNFGSASQSLDVLSRDRPG